MRHLPPPTFRLVAILALAALALGVGWAVASAPDPEQGFHLAYVDGQVVVESVDYGSSAQRAGLRPGQVVVLLQGQNVPNSDVFDLAPGVKQVVPQWAGPFWEVMTVSREQLDCGPDGRCLLPADYVADRQAPENTWSQISFDQIVSWGCLADPADDPDLPCRRVAVDLNAGDRVSGTYHVGVCLDRTGEPLPSADRFSTDTEIEIVCYRGNLDYTSWPETISLVPEPGASMPVSGAWSPPSGFGYSGPAGSWHSLYPFAPFSPKFPILLGAVVLLLGWGGLRRGWLGPTLKPYALSLPLATAVPLIGVAIDTYTSGPMTVFLALLLPLAMLPLAIDFLAAVEPGRRRRLVALATGLLAVGAAASGLLLPFEPAFLYWRSVLVGGVAFVPGLFAAHPFGRREVTTGGAWRSRLSRAVGLVPGSWAAGFASRLEPGQTAQSPRSARALVESFDTLLAAMTPGVACVSLAFVHAVEVWPILLWLGILALGTRQLLRPLARLATSATRQRDMVVAATEAERARIAADIHDDALQDLTMLVRRLEQSGDEPNARAAREVVERLRAICGDLRLPVLDDLGVGPALEWLCARMDPSGREIVLDRLEQENRLPADVELAAFRIAQEALSNAVRHGATPIGVRYRVRQDWLELEVDDSGRGIAEDSAEKAEQTGHMGLLNMNQRAEAIGANLQVGRRPQGGTRVRLLWDRQPAPAGAPAVETA